MRAVYGAVGVGGAGAGGFWAVWACGVMEPRNTLNIRKDFDKINKAYGNDRL